MANVARLFRIVPLRRVAFAVRDLAGVTIRGRCFLRRAGRRFVHGVLHDEFHLVIGDLRNAGLTRAGGAGIAKCTSSKGAVAEGQGHDGLGLAGQLSRVGFVGQCAQIEASAFSCQCSMRGD
jgi:hypothetical protein